MSKQQIYYIISLKFHRKQANIHSNISKGDNSHEIFQKKKIIIKLLSVHTEPVIPYNKIIYYFYVNIT